MLTSVRWLNDYLDPPASPDEQADFATRAGFPLEGQEEVLLGSERDWRQDFEMTSNRGDCVCHVGLAREIAAISGRELKAPSAAPKAQGPPAAGIVSVTNHETTHCPLYTAQIIRGVKVGPSPAWLADRLTARGDIPRNNVVDATNFVLFELGQPTHVFDLAKLRGPEIIVRLAKAKEPFLPIGEGESEIKLTADDLVIADAERAVAMAGVKGGALTAVSETTTDVLLEAASFNPVAVRSSSRRHNIASDSSYRFERGVHPGIVAAASARLAEIILDIAGGTLCEGVVSAGAPIADRRHVEMRPQRCRDLLGVPVSNERIMDAFTRLGFDPELRGERIACRSPYHRLDIEREIDLIEEVGRMVSMDELPIQETIEIRIAAPQPREEGHEAVVRTLVGMDFVESVTHSLVDEKAAKPFLPVGGGMLEVDDERAGAEPILRPSILPSLLRVLRHNHDNGVRGLRLFESAHVFWEPKAGDEKHQEALQLGLLMESDTEAHGTRPIRGIIERLVTQLCGPGVTIELADDSSRTWMDPGAAIVVNGETIGRFGRVASSLAAQYDVKDTLLGAELEFVPLYANYPPDTEAHALPQFPAIARDISAIIDESVTWGRVSDAIDALELANLEYAEFVTTFRGKSIPKGKKSLTLRLRFRASDRTLTHDEVDPSAADAIGVLEREFDAEIRT